jgi:hypothetical protein
MKHTPGPWKQDRFGHVTDLNGKEIVFDGLTCANGYTEDPTPKANTKLVAAAPELLEALKLISKSLSGMGDVITEDIKSIADKAIKKATE